MTLTTPRPHDVAPETTRLGSSGEAPVEAPETTGERPSSTWRTVLSGLWTGISYGLLALVLLMGTLVVVVPKAVGGVPLTVLSGSMEPNLPVGSLAVIKPVDPADVQVGDILTYLPHPDDPTAVTHRVVAIEHHQDGSLSFIVQGDANSAPDDPVEEYQVRGTVMYAVPWLGTVNTALNGDDTSAAVYVVAGAFFAWAVSLWWRAWRGRRHRRRAP